MSRIEKKSKTTLGALEIQNRYMYITHVQVWLTTIPFSDKRQSVTEQSNRRKQHERCNQETGLEVLAPSQTHVASTTRYITRADAVRLLCLLYGSIRNGFVLETTIKAVNKRNRPKRLYHLITFITSSVQNFQYLLLLLLRNFADFVSVTLTRYLKCTSLSLQVCFWLISSS